MREDILKSLNSIIHNDADSIPYNFYLRVCGKFYTVDNKMTKEDAKYIFELISSGELIEYVMNVTLNIDTVCGDIESAFKERNIQFSYTEYYKETVIDLCGKFTNKNEIYWHMVDIINRNHVNSQEFLSMLISHVNDGVNHILNRNRNYSIDEYNEDLDYDYFMSARTVLVVIDNHAYSIDSLTTIEDAIKIKNHIESGKPFTYISDMTWDVDTVVGDIQFFLNKNNIDDSDCLGVSRYYKVIESGNYKMSVNEIIKKLK